MKRIILMICAAITGLTASAQNEGNSKVNETAFRFSAASITQGYGCPVCSWNSESPGKCSYHNVDLIADGTYYCKTDNNVTSSKAGKCPRCSMPLSQMTTGRIDVAPSLVMVQDTTSRRPKKMEEITNDPAHEKDMHRDPDNRRIVPQPKNTPAVKDSLEADPR